jgi:hypothetical protein
MSESNPMEELIPEGKEDALNADPMQQDQRQDQELQGGGTDEDREPIPGEDTIRENVEAELGDRLENRGEDRL